jgi:DNA polymerase-3 subunit epsilon
LEKRTLFAIVDVETTGGSVIDERITEIAIYRFDGHEVVDKLVSLVNPERKIQDFVVKLTGITDHMVQRAPKFQEIAKRVVEITEGCTFVAHNADFDYRVIRKEFKRLGYDFDRDTLCTVQLSKKLIPEMPSYSLGKLCKSLGIPVSNRHRADGDAFATVKLLELLLQKDTEKNIISESVTDFDFILKKEKIKNVIDSTPDSTGVFYIHQSNGRIMYIGKARNMRQRVRDILARKTKKAESILSKMASVSYDETGNFIMARLKFNQEIEKHKPRFNSDFIKIKTPTEFNHPDMILISEGRNVSEKSVIVIENGILKGYGYVDLEYQITHLEILNNLIMPLTDSMDNRYIVKSSILKNRIQKIIRL